MAARKPAAQDQPPVIEGMIQAFLDTQSQTMKGVSEAITDIKVALQKHTSELERLADSQEAFATEKKIQNGRIDRLEERNQQQDGGAVVLKNLAKAAGLVLLGGGGYHVVVKVIHP